MAFDKATKEWFEKHPDAETTIMECDKCGLSYKPSLGHKCKYAPKQENKSDFVEVKRGHWERGWDNGDIYAYCTSCKRRMNYHCYGYAHCPLCGAKMDGGEKYVLSNNIEQDI